MSDVYDQALARARREFPHVQENIRQMIAYQRLYRDLRRSGQLDIHLLARARAAVDKKP